MNEIFIGEGKRGNSAVTVDIDTQWNISRNGYAFWLYNRSFRVQIFITKDTDEYNKLDSLFRDGNVEIIDNFLTSLMLKNISVDQFLETMHSIIDTSYVKGGYDKLQALKEILEIE